MPIEDDARHVNRRKQVGQQSYDQGDCETPYRTCTEQAQKQGRDNCSNVGVNDRQEGSLESHIHGRDGGLRSTQFFPDTFEDQDVRIDAHTNRQDYACNARQGKDGAEISERREQNNEVQDQRNDRVYPRQAVVHDHKNHYDQQADDGGLNPVTYRIRSEGGADRTLLEILDGGRKRAGTQYQREVIGLLFAKLRFDDSCVINSAIDGGRGLQPVLEDDTQLLADILFGEGSKRSE